MPLWGNLDNATGNQKPLFANTSNTTSASTINGVNANTNQYYGNMYGVSATEMQRVVSGITHPTHSGWVSQKIGTGPVSGINILTRGTGLNVGGYLTFTDSSPLGQGTGLNISYTIANTQNLLQASSSNSTLNGIATITINNYGSGFSNSSLLSLTPTGTYTTLPTFAIALGGRGDRIQYETIVATASITGDDAKDNFYFPGT